MEDPERVIAEALRAQAARTPLPSAEPTEPKYPGYGLLSGSDLPLALSTSPIESATESAAASSTRRIEPERRLSIGAILLLAVVLGLAAGAVVGLVTLL